MVSFALFSASTSPSRAAESGEPSQTRPPTAIGSSMPADHPPVPPGSDDKCPVDHTARAKWLENTTSNPHPFNPSVSSSNGQPSMPSSISISNSRGGKPRDIQLSQDRVISSIPRARASYPSPEGSVPYSGSSSSPASSSTAHSSGSLGGEGEEKWVYPSEAQFFQAMLRKNHKPQAADMRTIVPIHNAVNEKAWEEVLAWEAGMGGERCGGVRLVSFEGRPKEMTPKAWFKTLVGYTPPFDRHDWLIDRCGTHIRYVIDFYTGRSDPNRPGNMAFHLDVRPAVDSWEGVKTRLGGLWR